MKLMVGGRGGGVGGWGGRPRLRSGATGLGWFFLDARRLRLATWRRPPTRTPPCRAPQQIIEVNSELRQGLARGLPISSLAEHWDFLQVGGAPEGRRGPWQPPPAASSEPRGLSFLLELLRRLLSEASAASWWPQPSRALAPPTPPRPTPCHWPPHPPGLQRHAHQQRPAGRQHARPGRRARAPAARLRAAPQGQAGALPRQPQRQARRLQRAHGHQPRPQPGHQPGGAGRPGPWPRARAAAGPGAGWIAGRMATPGGRRRRGPPPSPTPLPLWPLPSPLRAPAPPPTPPPGAPRSRCRCTWPQR
jgi:hypothetical protein